jgi:hypothetical protein
MAYNHDWFPASRTEQLFMCLVWINVMNAETRTRWGIPADHFQTLGTLYAAAQAILQKAQTGDRSPIINEQCREAFAALEAEMRFFKAHFFLVPPLTNTDLVSLGLKPRDKHPTPGKKPTAEVKVEVFLVGPHQLGIRIAYVSGDPADRDNKGYRIWYKVVPPGGEPVTNPTQLTESFYTKRKKDLMEFLYTDSGKTVYFAVQVENDGKKGPWGPIVSAIIP